MAELEPERRRTLLLRAAGLVLLYGLTAVVMGAGLFALVQVLSRSFQYLPVPHGQAGGSQSRQAPR